MAEMYWREVRACVMGAGMRYGFPRGKGEGEGGWGVKSGVRE